MFRNTTAACLFLLVLLSNRVFADTVLLYTTNDDFKKDDYIETEVPERMPSVTIVEDGVMSLFFERGHIIFNAGIIGKEKKPAGVESSAFRLAKNGGANLLLEVALGYSHTEAGIYATPTTASYRLIEIPSEKVLTEALLETKSLRGNGMNSEEEVCFLLGQSIAAGALSVQSR